MRRTLRPIVRSSPSIEADIIKNEKITAVVELIATNLNQIDEKREEFLLVVLERHPSGHLSQLANGVENLI